jgi:hypothetical protein
MTSSHTLKRGVSKDKEIYGIEVYVHNNIWHLRDDKYTESELELAKKNLAYSRRICPESKFRIVKLNEVTGNSSTQ